MKFLSFVLSTITFLSIYAKADDGIDTTNYSAGVYEYLKELSGFCQVAYCIQELDRDDFEVGEMSCNVEFCEDHPGVEVKKIFVSSIVESGSGYILVDHTKKRILVIFRGSQTVFDWIADLTFLPVPYTPLTKQARSNYTCTDCYAHEGFYNTLKQFSDDVFPYVKELKEGNYSDYQVVTSGHSLGGALTALAGVEFLLMGYDPLVIGVAGPKVGNENMINYMNEIFDTETVISDILAGKELSTGYIRVVHQGDIVPLLPPTTYFWHAGAEFYIDKFLLPHPQSVTHFRGDYQYESIIQSEVTSYIAVHNFLFIYDHISYFVSMATCIVGNVFDIF